MNSIRHLVLSKAHRRWLPLLVLCANLAITLPLAAVLNIWQDEAYTLHTIGGDVAYAFSQAVGFEQNAPLYFVVMSLWRHAGGSIFFLRLFSVLCVAAVVWLVPGLVRRYVPAADGIVVAAVVACNPFVVWAAVELRVYAAIVLLSALLLLTFFDAFLYKKPSRAATIGFALCVALALYTQYYLAFLIAAQGVTLAVYNRRTLPSFMLASAAGFLAFAPMLAIIPGQVQNFKGIFASPSIAQTCLNLAGIAMRYELPLPLSHAKYAYVALVAAAALLIAFARPSLRELGGRPIVLMTSFAFAFFAGGTYLAGVHVLERHAASLYLAGTLAVFAVVTSVRWRQAALGWSAFAIVLSLFTLVHSYQHLAKPGDWIRASAYVRAHERAKEPIAVFEAENALPFAFYYAGVNRVVPIPHGVDFRRYDVGRFVIQDDRQLGLTMPPDRRVWLVTAGDCTSANVRFGCNLLENFIARRYRIESDAQFFGARIRLIERSATGSPARSTSRAAHSS